MPSGSKRRKAAKKPKPEGPPLSPNDPLEAELVPELVPEEEGMGQDDEEFTDEAPLSPKAAEDDAEAMIIKPEHKERVERAMSEDLGSIQTKGDHGVHEDNGKAHPASLAESESETLMDTQPGAHTQSLDKAEPDILMEIQTEAPTGTEPDEEALKLVRDGASAPEVEPEIDEEANVNTSEIEAENELTSDNAIQPEIATASTKVVPETSEGAADVEPDSTTGPDEAEAGAVPATDQETSTGPSDEAVGLNTASDAAIDAALVDPELDTGTKLATATALFDVEHGIGSAPIETTPGLETELAEDKHVEDETIESEDKVADKVPLEAERGDLPEVVSRETQVEPPEETESVVPTEEELPGDTEPGAEIVSEVGLDTPDEADANEAPLQAETEDLPGVISREAVVEVEPLAEHVVPLVEETPPDVVSGEADVEVGPSTEVELAEQSEAAAEIVRAETLDEAGPNEDEGEVEPPTEIGSPGEMEPAEDIVPEVRAKTPGEVGSDSIEAESVLVPLEQAEPGAEPDVEPLQEISAPPDVGTAVEVAMDSTGAESISALLEQGEPGAEPYVEPPQENSAVPDVGTAVEVAMDSTEAESISALLEQAEPGAEPGVEPLQESGAPPDVGTAVEVAMDSTEAESVSGPLGQAEPGAEPDVEPLQESGTPRDVGTAGEVAMDLTEAESVSAPLEQAEPGAEPDVEPLQESSAPPDVGTAVEVMIEPEAEVETPFEGGSDHKDLTEEDSSRVDKDSSIKLDADGEAVEELEPAPEVEPLQELHSAPDVEIPWEDATDKKALVGTGVKVETPMDAELKFGVEASLEDQCDLVEVEPEREVEGLAQTEGHEGSLAEIEEQIEPGQPNLCGESGGNSELNEQLDMVSASKEVASLGAVPATETTNDADDEPVHEKEVIKSKDEAEKSATPEQGEGIRLAGGVPDEQVSGIDVEGTIEPAVTEPGIEFKEGRVDQERAVGDEMLLGKDQDESELLVLCEQGVDANTSVAYEEGAGGGHGEEERIIVLPQATDEFELESEAHTKAEDTKAAAFDPKVHLKSLLCEQEKDIGDEEAVSSVMAEAGSVLGEDVSENFHPEFESDDQEMGLSEPRDPDDALSIDEAEEQFGMDSKHRLDSEPSVIDEDNHGSGKEEPDDADGTSDLTEAPQAESIGVAHLDQVPFCHQEKGQPDFGNEEMDFCKKRCSDNGEIDHTEDRNLDVPVCCALTSVPTTMSMSTATEADALDTRNPNGDSHINEMREVEAYLLEVDHSNGHKEATNRAEETVPRVEEVLRSLPEHDVEEASMPMVVPDIKKRAFENENPKSTEHASGGATLERRTKWLGCCGMFDAILGKG